MAEYFHIIIPEDSSFDSDIHQDFMETWKWSCYLGKQERPRWREKGWRS